MKSITLSAASGAVDSGNDPVVSITVTPAMSAGQTLRFSLTVVDANGIASQPAFVDVPVVGLPVAVLTGPAAVATGATISLDATRSTPAGQIASFRWQLVSSVPIAAPVATPTPTSGAPITPGKPVVLPK